MSTNTAWVTLATNDSYCLGALVLAHSLRRVNTGHQLAVLITPGVSPSMRQQLSSVFNVVQEVDVMNSGDEANLALMARPDLGVTFTKLHCWNLTQFSKCVFLDADTLVIQNCDELFEREELSAAPDVGWPDCFNSGVFVFIPSKDTFKALLNCALAQGSFDGGDQGLLNTYFGDWATKDIKKHLPFIYNMVSTATYSYLPAFKLFGSQVKIVHFLGINKPWLQGSGATAPTMSSYLDLWWNIFRSQVSQTLTKDMAGLAGALAAGERSAFEEVWRRQNWEQGVIDYMGRDSFDNIWKRISESVGLSSTPSTAVPPAPPAPAPAPQSAEIKPSAPSETVQDKTKEPSAQTESPVTPAVLVPLQSDPTTAQSEQPKVEVSVKAAPEPKTEATPEVPKTEETSVPPVAQAAEPSPTDKQTAVVPEAPKVPEDKEKMSTISEKKTETSSAETPKSEPSEVKEGEKPKEEVKPPAAVPTTDTSSPVADAEASKEKSQELSKSDAPSAPLPTPQATESMPQKEEPLAKKETSALTSSVPEKATDSQKEASVEVKKPQQTEGEKDSTSAIKETEKKAPTEDKSQKEPTKASQETTKSEVPTSVPTEIKKSDVSPPIPLPEAPKAETPVETPKADATAAAPKTDIPAETTKAEVPSAEAKDAKAIPSQKEEKGDKAKEAVSPGAAKAEELKTSAPGTETAAQKVETPKDDTTPKKQTSQTASAEKPTTETPKSDSTQKEQPSPATAPVAEPTLAAAVTSKDSVPATGGDVSEPLGTAMPSSPGASGIPELPSEGAATLSKPSSEPKKSATPSAAPQTPPAESSSAEKSVAAPVPPKRKGNKEQKSQNGGKQSKSKK